MKYTLYHYWRSSSSWRVRMALYLKGIQPDYVHVNLLQDEQNASDYLKINPTGLVPALKITHGKHKYLLNESVAIIEWLEESITELYPLLPQDKFDRARIRQLVQIINSNIQPIQNLRVLKALFQEQAERAHWAREWIEKGFCAYEKIVENIGGKYSFGDEVTMADLFLIPQCYNAGRFNVDLDQFPKIKNIYSQALKQEFVQKTAPDVFQP